MMNNIKKIIGLLCIIIGIAAKGQNVAHLVALAFAVAASSNLPCVLLTLYWKRCNTGGIMLGMIVGAFSAIALVMVSPNMTYPKAVKAAAHKTIDSAPTTLAKLESELASTTDPKVQEKNLNSVNKLKQDVAKAEANLKKYADTNTSIVGLEEPWLKLKNPGIYSIPLGFLCVIFGSCCTVTGVQKICGKSYTCGRIPAFMRKLRQRINEITRLLTYPRCGTTGVFCAYSSQRIITGRGVQDRKTAAANCEWRRGKDFRIMPVLCTSNRYRLRMVMEELIAKSTLYQSNLAK